MHEDDAEQAPRHQPQGIALAPRLRRTHHPQKAAADEQRRRNAQLDREVQRQVVGVVEDHGETRAVVQRGEVREAEFAPAPAGEGALSDQGESVLPEDDAAVGSDGGGLQAVEHAGAGGDRVASVTAAGQVRQQPVQGGVQRDGGEQERGGGQSEVCRAGVPRRPATLPPRHGSGTDGDQQQLQEAGA
ncbi:hypothetical protein D3C87_859890 [compost metagenome]